jgi:hypothetical protein
MNVFVIVDPWIQSVLVLLRARKSENERGSLDLKAVVCPLSRPAFLAQTTMLLTDPLASRTFIGSLLFTDFFECSPLSCTSASQKSDNVLLI